MVMDRRMSVRGVRDVLSGSTRVNAGRKLGKVLLADVAARAHVILTAVTNIINYYQLAA